MTGENYNTNNEEPSLNDETSAKWNSLREEVPFNQQKETTSDELYREGEDFATHLRRKACADIFRYNGEKTQFKTEDDKIFNDLLIQIATEEQDSINHKQTPHQFSLPTHKKTGEPIEAIEYIRSNLEDFAEGAANRIYPEVQSSLEEVPDLHSFTKEQIINDLGNISYDRTNESGGDRIIEDYRDLHYEQLEKEYGSKNNLEQAIEDYFNLEDKNDFKKIEKIGKRINDAIGLRMQLPEELQEFRSALNKQLIIYTNQERKEKREELNKKNERIKEEALQEIKEAQRPEEEFDAQAFFAKSGLFPTPNNSTERDNLELVQENLQPVEESQTPESSLDIAQDQISLEEKEDNENAQEKQAVESINSSEQMSYPEKVELIWEPGEKIKEYDKQIEEMAKLLEPYMQQVPKVNEEVSKALAKSREADVLQLTDDRVRDFRKKLEMKEQVMNYLNQATEFIKNNANKHNTPSQSQEQSQPQELPDDFWKDFDQPEEEQAINNEELPEGFWDEFDKPVTEKLTRPEKMYNSDGTYTVDYMAYLAASSPGLEKKIWEQLEQFNAEKRRQNQLGQKHTEQK